MMVKLLKSHAHLGYDKQCRNRTSEGPLLASSCIRLLASCLVLFGTRARTGQARFVLVTPYYYYDCSCHYNYHYEDDNDYHHGHYDHDDGDRDGNNRKARKPGSRQFTSKQTRG